MNQKETLEIKTTVTEMKNTFDGLISRLGTVEKRISEVEDISIKFSKTEKQREQRQKSQDRLSGNCGKAARSITYAQWEYQKEKKERKKPKTYLMQDG